MMPRSHRSDNNSLDNELLLENTIGCQDNENPLVSHNLEVLNNGFRYNDNLHFGDFPGIFLLEKYF